MPLSVRLDDDTRKLLNRLARESRVSRSEVVRRGIRLLAENDDQGDEAIPYDKIRHLIGSIRGGPADLSERTGKNFRKILAERQARRR